MIFVPPFDLSVVGLPTFLGGQSSPLPLDHLEIILAFLLEGSEVELQERSFQGRVIERAIWETNNDWDTQMDVLDAMIQVTESEEKTKKYLEFASFAGMKVNLEILKQKIDQRLYHLFYEGHQDGDPDQGPTPGND